MGISVDVFAAVSDENFEGLVEDAVGKAGLEGFLGFFKDEGVSIYTLHQDVGESRRHE